MNEKQTEECGGYDWYLWETQTHRDLGVEEKEGADQVRATS